MEQTVFATPQPTRPRLEFITKHFFSAFQFWAEVLKREAINVSVSKVLNTPSKIQSHIMMVN